MSGAEPMLIGAALGGGLSAARGGNPLQGALLGGVTGGIGGSIWGSAADAAKTAAIDTAANPANYVSPTSFMGVAKQLPSAAWEMAKANPAVAMQGMGMAAQMMQPHPMQMGAPSPLLHGQVAQDDQSYLSLLPQRQAISLI